MNIKPIKKNKYSMSRKWVCNNTLCWSLAWSTFNSISNFDISLSTFLVHYSLDHMASNRFTRVSKFVWPVRELSSPWDMQNCNRRCNTAQCEQACNYIHCACWSLVESKSSSITSVLYGLARFQERAANLVTSKGYRLWASMIIIYICSNTLHR